MKTFTTRSLKTRYKIIPSDCGDFKNVYRDGELAEAVLKEYHVRIGHVGGEQLKASFQNLEIDIVLLANVSGSTYSSDHLWIFESVKDPFDTLEDVCFVY